MNWNNATGPTGGSFSNFNIIRRPTDNMMQPNMPGQSGPTSFAGPGPTFDTRSPFFQNERSAPGPNLGTSIGGNPSFLGKASPNRMPQMSIPGRMPPPMSGQLPNGRQFPGVGPSGDVFSRLMQMFSDPKFAQMLQRNPMFGGGMNNSNNSAGLRKTQRPANPIMRQAGNQGNFRGY